MSVVFVIFSIIIFMTVLTLIIYFAVKASMKGHDTYKIFAEQQGWEYEPAQGEYGNYRAFVQKRVSLTFPPDVVTINLPLSYNPWLKQYGFSAYPFKRGNNRKIAHIISGEFEGYKFYTYLYLFQNSLTGGGLFGIYAIEVDKMLCRNLPQNTHYENGKLWCWSSGNLKPELIRSYLEQLILIKNGRGVG